MHLHSVKECRPLQVDHEKTSPTKRSNYTRKVGILNSWTFLSPLHHLYVRFISTEMISMWWNPECMIFQISILFPPEPAILNSLDLTPGFQDSSQFMKVVGWDSKNLVDPTNSDVETANVSAARCSMELEWGQGIHGCHEPGGATVFFGVEVQCLW